MEQSRKYYLDNIRTICILLLFPYHACMVYNGFEGTFYVYNRAVPLCDSIILAIYPWFMPILFVAAGISSRFSLGRRTAKAYAAERVKKLLLPLIAGLLLLVPPQTYMADVWNNGFKGSYFDGYVTFFTRFTDLNGYDGGFTPAHLWFILYLFVISMLALPIMNWYQRRERKLDADKITIPRLLPIFLLSCLAALILDIGGKSLGEYFLLFMAGYFLLSEDAVVNRLERYRCPLTAAAIACTIGIIVLQVLKLNTGIPYDIFQRLVMWVSILAILGLSKRFLNFRNKAMDYLAHASFPIYIFHQTWVVAAAFFVLRITDSIPLQIALIIFGSFVLTIATYEVFRRIPPLRFLFGIRK